MKNGDVTTIVLYGIGFLTCLIYGIKIIRKTKTREGINDGWSVILFGITPISMVIFPLCICGLIVNWIIEGPTKLISRIKGIK